MVMKGVFRTLVVGCMVLQMMLKDGLCFGIIVIGVVDDFLFRYD